MKRILVFLACFLVVHILSFGQEKQPDELLKNAIYQEEVKGNLEEAILIYKDIIKNYPEQRALTAEALFHLGLSNEKLGNKKAKEYYEKVVNNFSDQPKFARIAMERLSRLLKAEKELKIPLEPKITKIEIPTKPGNGVLSPDGKKLAYISEKSLWVVPVHGKTNRNITGEPVRLTESMDAWDLANMGTVWSANGKWLAFYVVENREDVIYIVSANGGKPVKVSINPQRQNIRSYDYRISLSPEGKMLALVNRNEDKNSFIYTFSIREGTYNQLTGPGTREPAFSPDGKLIAYVKTKTDNNLGDEIWVIPSEGGNPVMVSDDADVVKSPVWSPDGSMIAFLGRKYEKGWANNSNELWIAEVDNNGIPTGLITKTELSNSTTLMLAGWSPDNKIGIWLSKPEKNLLYTVPATGGQAMQVTSENSWMPCWSPDGKSLYFDGINTDKYAGLESTPSQGGEVSRIPVRFRERIQPEMPIGGISVSPDGKKIVFETYYNNITDSTVQKKPEGSHHIVAIPVNGGSPFELTSNSLLDGYPVWSPDGREVAFLRQEDKIVSNGNLYTVTADGGTLKKITSLNDSVTFGRIDWSPDGKWIGFFSADKTIKIIPSKGGSSKVVVKDVEAHSHFGLSFSPEGDKIVYSNKEKLFVADLNTGKSEEVRTGLYAVPTMPDWSPDGRKIAFCAYDKGETDLWFMEDFLPLEKLAQNEGTEAAKEPEGIVIKQLPDLLGEVSFGTPSIDGKYFSFMDGETGNLAIRDLNTEKTQIVTTEGTWDGPLQFANFSKISPDNKWVAYSWQYVDKGNKFDLRVLNMDNPSPRILYEMKDGEVHPAFWLSDNKRLIAYTINTKNHTYQIISVKTDDGSFNVLNTSKKLNGIPGLCLSSDEKYIAFDFLNGVNKNFDIYSIPVEGGPEVPLVEHPANDRTLGWLPGRKELLFLSDRSGTWDIWSLTVAKGKPNGQPKLIFSDAGEIKPVEITRDGTLYFSRFGRKFTITISPFNTNEEKIKKESGIPLLGSNYDAEWSPDGQSIVYAKEIMETVRNATKLYVFNLNTGKEHPIAENLEVLQHVSWSPKENSILALGLDNRKISDENYLGGIYNIDVKTGKENELLSFTRDSFKDQRQVFNMAVEWSLDAKSFFYIMENRIIQFDLETGLQKTFYTAQNSLKYLKRFFQENDLVFMDGNQIMKASGENGDIKRLCSLEDSQRIGSISWSPDGNYIYLYVDGWLCKLPSEGGTIQKVCPLENETRFVSFHPEGKKIAITRYDQKAGFLVMENLVQKLEKIYSQNE